MCVGLPRSVCRRWSMCRFPSCHVRTHSSPQTRVTRRSGTIERGESKGARASVGLFEQVAARRAWANGQRQRPRRRSALSASVGGRAHRCGGLRRAAEPPSPTSRSCLVAADGEWTRRRAGGDAGARRLSDRLNIPGLRRAEGRVSAADARLRRASADRTATRRTPGARRTALIRYRRSHQVVPGREGKSWSDSSTAATESVSQRMSRAIPTGRPWCSRTAGRIPTCCGTGSVPLLEDRFRIIRLRQSRAWASPRSPNPLRPTGWNASPTTSRPSSAS